MFDKILNIFLKSNLKIKNRDNLEKYIQFCIDNNTTKIKGETADHHILPRSPNLPFVEFSNLVECSWNCSTLSHKNHYIAHWLLFDSIDHMSISHSFVAMTNKDVRNNRLHKDVIASADVYDEAMKERSKHQQLWRKETSAFDENLTNSEYYARKGYNTKKSRFYQGMQFDEWQSNRMAGKNNIVYRQGVVDKILKTKSNTYINGHNMHTESSIRAANTMKQEIITDSGEVSTIYRENGKKISNYLNQEIVLDNGQVTTIAKERGLKHSKVLSTRGKRFILKSVFRDDINYVLYAVDIRRISPGLHNTNVEKYLGASSYGRTYFIQKNKENLIGLYCIPTELDATLIDNWDDFIKKL